MELPCILSFAVIVAPRLECAADGEEAQGLSGAKLGSHAKETVIPIEIVITGLDPVIHLLRKNFLRRLMDARIKSGHDGCVLWFTPFSDRHCERSEAIHQATKRKMDCFAEPVIGRAFARPVGSQ
jgi:hypothetical protein